MRDCAGLVVGADAKAIPVEERMDQVPKIRALCEDFQQLSSATSGGPMCPQLQHSTWTSSRG
jgi:hypothetical protein